MFTTVLLGFHIFIVILLILFVLLQKSDGGALGIGGGNGFMNARGSANLLTRITAVLATLFFISTLILAINFKGIRKSGSILSGTNQADVAKNKK